MRRLEPLLRKKTRSIQIMGGLYEEVTKETEEAIVKVMNKPATTVDQPQDDKVMDTEINDAPNEQDDSMVIGAARITIDRNEDHFGSTSENPFENQHDFNVGNLVIGNVVDYSSLEDEDM